MRLDGYQIHFVFVQKLPFQIPSSTRLQIEIWIAYITFRIQVFREKLSRVSTRANFYLIFDDYANVVNEYSIYGVL